MNDSQYTIQELSDASGVARRNIYFYTQQGILPPPEGAGLAARYGEIHILRLKAIPILRSQGLKLDEIRKRLQSETLESLRQLTAVQPILHSSRADYILQEDQIPSRDEPGLPLLNHANLNGRAVRQYDLPGGLTITAPAAMTPLERRRLTRLLAAARQIYLAPQLPQDGGKE